MSVPVQRALTATLDAQAVNHAQATVLYDPSPEVDSLRERIEQLEVLGVPRPTIELLLSDCDRALFLNGHELGYERRAAGVLDGLLSAARDGRVAAALGVKSLAKALRPLLASSDPLDVRRRRRLLAEHRDRVESTSLHHELGAGKTALLLDDLRAMDAVDR